MEIYSLLIAQFLKTFMANWEDKRQNAEFNVEDS